MFCKYCGNSIADTATFCQNCGAHTDAGAQSSQTDTVQPPVQPVAFPEAPQHYVVPPQKKTNGMAIAAFICSIASPVLCCIPAIVGIILGIVAKKQINERGEQGSGFATAAIVIGAILAALLIGYIVIVAVAAAGSYSNMFDDVYDEIWREFNFIRAIWS